jgi:putative tricarboxylic transport membrane protein
MYSFIGTLFGFVALFLVAKPISSLALRFTPMDYFLLALFGLTAVGSLTSKQFSKGLISAALGLLFSMIGIDSVMGTARMTFGIRNLQAGINIVPALVGLFGFSEVLMSISSPLDDGEVAKVSKTTVKLKELLRYTPMSLWYATIGVFVGALPGAGGLWLPFWPTVRRNGWSSILQFPLVKELWKELSQVKRPIMPVSAEQ